VRGAQEVADELVEVRRVQRRHHEVVLAELLLLRLAEGAPVEFDSKVGWLLTQYQDLEAGAFRGGGGECGKRMEAARGGSWDSHPGVGRGLGGGEATRFRFSAGIKQRRRREEGEEEGDESRKKEEESRNRSRKRVNPGQLGVNLHHPTLRLVPLAFFSKDAAPDSDPYTWGATGCSTCGACATTVGASRGVCTAGAAAPELPWVRVR